MIPFLITPHTHVSNMTLIDNFLHPKTNAEEAVSLLCESFKLKLSDGTLCRQLKRHPFYPSMLAIHDVMENFGVASVAYKCSDVQEVLKVETSFLSQVSDGSLSNHKLFATVFGRSDNAIDWFNPKEHKRELISIDKFSEVFTGYAMFFATTKDEGGLSHKGYRWKENLQRAIEYLAISMLPIALMVISVYKGLVGSIGVLSLAYSVFLLIGCVVCSLLLMHEYNAYNPVVMGVCGDNKKVNCNAVLASSGATFANIPWAVIGSVYFLGSLCASLSSCMSERVITCLAYMNIVAIPYTAYSLYYQKRVVKQWCPLCLAVLAVIWGLFAISLLNGSLSRFSLMTPEILCCVFVSMFLSALGVFLLWKFGIILERSEESEHSLSKIKYDRAVFEALLRKERKVSVPIEGFGITLGNPNGMMHIIEVCNPFCGHCGKAQKELSKLVKNNSNICLQIIFVSGPTNVGYDHTPVDTFLTLQKEAEDMSTVLNDWFALSVKNVEEYEKLHPVKSHRSKDNDDNAQRMSEFCDAMKITHTPTIFIDGYEMPRLYNVGDLKYII